MSLYPGGRSSVSPHGPSVEDEALTDSLAHEIEIEFESLFASVKGIGVPAQHREDRRILFVAIARGVLGFIKNKQSRNITARPLPDRVQVTFNVNMDNM